MSDKKVRFGIVGLGNMGSEHVHSIMGMNEATVGAVCDVDLSKTEKYTARYGMKAFSNHREMIKSGLIDAVLVSTPHYDHVPIGIDALEGGLHVLVEKPIAVSVKAARQIIEVSKKFPNQKFGIMFNQRTNPMYQKMRELIADGELGTVRRVTWLITDWFRTWSYYASGGWRATWAGEGGGVLINQCPHNLDLIQWVTGMMPNRITAVGFVGKTHPIEVEDEMSAILEYPNGAIGHFVTSTGEAPGTNRFEICGDRGKIVAEHGKITFTRTRENVQEVNQKSPKSFAGIETWTIDIPYPRAEGGEHKRLTENFIKSILHGTPMLGPGVEGIHGLEIGNAMMMSGLTRKPVELPVDGDTYDAFLSDMAKQYGGRKTLTTKKDTVDMSASFAKA